MNMVVEGRGTECDVSEMLLRIHNHLDETGEHRDRHGVVQEHVLYTTLECMRYW